MFATSEGYKALGPALAEVDLRVGGRFARATAPTARSVDAETIENVILAYEPPTMLATRIQKTPATFPFKEPGRSRGRTTTLTPVDGGQTHIRVTSLGYGPDEESLAMRLLRARNQQTIDTFAVTSEHLRRSPPISSLLHNHNNLRSPVHVVAHCARGLGRRARRRRDLDLLLGPRCSRQPASLAAVACGCHYHCGGKMTTRGNTIVLPELRRRHRHGARCCSRQLGALGAFAAPVAVGLGATVIVLTSKLPFLAVIPASVYGFASIAGLALLGTGMTPTTALVPTIQSGDRCRAGYVSEAIAGALTKNNRATARAARAARA